MTVMMMMMMMMMTTMIIMTRRKKMIMMVIKVKDRLREEYRKFGKDCVNSINFCVFLRLALDAKSKFAMIGAATLWHSMSQTICKVIKTQKSIFCNFAKFTLHNLLRIYSIDADGDTDGTEQILMRMVV